MILENTGSDLVTGWSAFDPSDGRAVAWGDVSRDGRPELFVANGSAEPDRMYGWNEGEFGVEWATSEFELRTTLDAALGDVDGDGVLELAFAFEVSPNDVNYWDGTDFDFTGVINPSDLRSTAMAWADIDENGLADLAVGYLDAPDQLLRGWEIGPVREDGPPGEFATTDLSWGDADGDGLLDLAVATGPEEPVLLYRRTASTFTLLWESTELDASTAVDWGDMDGDGDLDLAVANCCGVPDRVYRNVGEPDWLELDWESEEGTDTQDLAWADWDGDGDRDLALARADEPGLVIHESASGPGTIEIPRNTGFVGAVADVRAAWADWDADGDLDLAVVAHWGGLDGPTVKVFEWRPTGFVEAEEVQVPGTPMSLAWGDYDDDGDLDLAVGCRKAALVLYRNTGGALEAVWSGEPEASTFSLAWGDWDGDGDLDLATGEWWHPNRIYENTGGELALAWSSPAAQLNPDGQPDSTRAVVWGDWDGDLDLDLAVINDDDPTRILENRGGDLVRVWETPEVVTAFSGDWGDWDGDGDLDLVIGAWDARPRLYENVGGSMELVVDQLPTPSKATAVRWIDWEGDGDLDLFVAGYDEFAALHRNDGGELVEAWAVPSIGQNLQDGAVGDFDRDGDPDIVVPRANLLTHRVYVNNTLGPARLPNNPTRAVMQPLTGVAWAPRGQSTARVLLGPTIEVGFLLLDAESDPAPSVHLEYSILGGGLWRPASVSGPTSGLEASPEGVTHSLVWDVATDGVEGDDVAVRVVVDWQAPHLVAFPVQRGAIGAPPVRARIRLECFPDDLDSDGDGSPCREDCDDDDPTVHPGAEERWDDGVDSDCDGVEAEEPAPVPLPFGVQVCSLGSASPKDDPVNPAPLGLWLMLASLGHRRRRPHRSARSHPGRFRQRPRSS